MQICAVCTLSVLIFAPKIWREQRQLTLISLVSDGVLAGTKTRLLKGLRW